MTQPIRISTLEEEGKLNASKWLKVQVLLDDDEMKELLQHLEPFSIYCTSDPITLDQARISPDEFSAAYSDYIRSLKEGQVPAFSKTRRLFSSIFTSDFDCVYAMRVGTEKFLIKTIQPVIQLQAHHFYYSSLDAKFHSMVLGAESVTWGIQFSYPQIFQHPKSHDYSKVTSAFPNTALYLKLTRWLRHHSLPTPFLVNEERVNVPIRLGKKCFSWIEQHPQLQSKGFSIVERSLT